MEKKNKVPRTSLKTKMDNLLRKRHLKSKKNQTLDENNIRNIVNDYQTKFSQIISATVINCNENIAKDGYLLLRHIEFAFPNVNYKFPYIRLLIPTRASKFFTVYDQMISVYNTRFADSNICSRNINHKPLQHMDSMVKHDGMQFVSRYSTAVSRLHKFVSVYDKSVKYNMLSKAGVFPNGFFTYRAKCGKIVTYGHGSSSYEAANDAANKFLDKLACISKLDEYFLNSKKSSCLENNVTLAQSNNYIGILQELCVTRAWKLPKYEYYQDFDSEYNQHFYIAICSAGSYKSTGTGKTKQIAKNQSAYFTYNQINLSQNKTNKTITPNARNEKTIDFVQDLAKNETENEALNKAMDQIYHVNSNKTIISTNYIGKLQEMCVALGCELPKYEYHQENDNENKKHLYCAICSAGPYKFKSVGITKRIAKNQAAHLVYNQINMNRHKISETYMSNPNSGKTVYFAFGLSKNEAENDTANMALDQNYHTNTDETKMFTNYIGELQEICVALGWELPNYEYHRVNDIENKKYLYFVICSAGPYKSTGTGSAKQIAKKQAAQLVFNQINWNQQETSKSRENFTHEIADKYSNQLLWSKKECMQKLMKCNSLDELNMSAFKFLKKLANEDVCGTKYIPYQVGCCEIEMFLEITKLTTTPCLISLGIGKTIEEAQNSAAKCALNYIKRFLI